MASIEDQLIEIIVDKLGVDPSQVTREASFIEDLGADSLDTMELIMAIEEKFGIDIPDSDAEKLATVGSAIDYIKKQIAEEGIDLEEEEEVEGEDLDLLEEEEEE